MAVAVALSHLSKAFGPTNALTDLSLSFERGKVHAIVGENGSGKSTMIKLLSGVYHPDSGTIRFPDHLYQRLSVEESRAEGVAVIHQDRTLVPTLSVRENLFLGVPVPHSFGRMNVGEMDRQATEAMESIGVSLNLSVPVSRLSPIDQTLVLLTRMQMQRARIVILDEVTAALGLNARIASCCPGRGAHDALFDAIACAVLLEHFLALPGWEHVTVDALAGR